MSKDTLLRTVVSSLVLLLVAQVAAADQRLYDKEVKLLLGEVERDLQRFVKGIEPEYRKGTLRSSEGEVKVSGYLDDLTKSCKQISARMTSDYAASGEVKAFLVLVSAVKIRSDAGRPLFGAEEEWRDLEPRLSRLADVYGVDWRDSGNPTSWNARRYPDREVKGFFSSLGVALKGYGKHLKGDLKRDKSLDGQQRKAIAAEVASLGQKTKDLEKAFGRQAAVGPDVEALVNGLRALGESMNEHPLSAATTADWGQVQNQMGNLTVAFRL